MTTVWNLVPEESHKFFSTIGKWNASGATLSFTNTIVRPESNSSSLRIYDNVTGGTASACLDITDDLAKANDLPLRAFVYLYLDKTTSASVSFEFVRNGVSSSSVQSLAPKKWTFFSIDLTQAVKQTSSLALIIKSSSLAAGDSIYVSRPTVMSPWAAAYSIFGSEVWLRLPEYLRTVDKNQTSPDLPLFRFVETIFGIANSIYSTWDEFRWIPPEDYEEEDGAVEEFKESALVSPNISSIMTLIWVSQVIGSLLVDPSKGYTPWNALAKYQTWEKLVLNLDVDNPKDGLQWDEIQFFASDITDALTAFRAQVNGGFYGYKAGTNKAIIAAVKSISGLEDQVVTLTSRYNNDPFSLRVSIPASKSGLISAVETALSAATPAGYQITVVAS